MKIHYRWKPSKRHPMPNPERTGLGKLIRRAAELAGLPVENDWQASVHFVGPNPITFSPVRASISFSKPSKAPPQINNMLDVSILIYSC